MITLKTNKFLPGKISFDSDRIDILLKELENQCSINYRKISNIRARLIAVFKTIFGAYIFEGLIFGEPFS